MSAAPAPPSRAHWIVRMNWRNRSLFFAMLFVVLGSHLLAVGGTAWAWALLALNCLVYPHVVYWRGLRASNPRQTEIRHMDLDIVLAGIWCTALGFPLWIVFIVCAAGCTNEVVFHGAQGGLRLVAALVLGSVIGALVFPLAWRPETDLRTTLLCMGALLLHLYGFARDGYNRALEQHRAHRQMRVQFDEIRSLQAQLREQALRDPLTGLFNRRHTDTALPHALERSRVAGTPLALLMIDVDHFKRINDTHGHAAGDAMLQALASLLQSHARAGDLASRMGGEEFLLVLDNTSLAQGHARAQALRAAFEALEVVHGTTRLRATLSCGLAACPDHGHDAPALVAAADSALYAAKQAGRNRVQARSPAAQPAAHHG